MDHAEQVERVKAKLNAARQADKRLNVFGARSHKYEVGRPAQERDVQAFEQRYSIILPACYRAFVTQVGNGGPSHRHSGAGPFYGIYPLGDGVDDILENPTDSFQRPAIIEPSMTDEDWSRLTHRIDENDISDIDYEGELEKLYAGLLPIGSQGCAYLHGLVVSGLHKGRVVNLDLDQQKPKFAFEKNFLDWYERWLDEVISGYLIQNGPTWFGYTMGGDDKQLMHLFAETAGLEERIEVLMGLAKLSTATEASCRKLLELCVEQDTDIRHRALNMLTKFAYPMAHEPLHAHIEGDDDDCLAACQSLFWYAKDRSEEWVDVLRNRLPTVNKPETFHFLSYLLKEARIDFSDDLRPFCEHQEEDIRIATFYSLGNLKSRELLVELFVLGLQDESARVVHATLQALAGVRDQRLLHSYTRLIERFETDEHYVLTNLEHRLKDMGISSIESFRKQVSN